MIKVIVIPRDQAQAMVDSLKEAPCKWVFEAIGVLTSAKMIEVSEDLFGEEASGPKLVTDTEGPAT